MKNPLENLEHTIQVTISSFTKIVSFKKKEILFSNDELLKYFYIVKSGKLKTYQLNLTTSKEQTIQIFREGDMFDTIVLLDGKPHDVLYESLTDVELIQMPIESVRELLTTSSEFNKKFFPYIAKQIRDTEELATDMSLYSTYERLVKLLLQNLDPSNFSKYKLINNLSNTEIAKLLGTVRHVVERHLKQLKNLGAIETKSKNIKIIDTKKLIENIKMQLK